MKNIMVLILCCFLALALLSCVNVTPADDETGQSEDVNEAEEAEETLFSQDDFALRIDTLPYRGAVLFIDYLGEIDISEYQLTANIRGGGNTVQRNMVGEYVDDNLIIEIIDFMYLPDDELEFVLKIKKEKDTILEFNYSEQLQRYPWKDWMLAEGEWFSIEQPFGIGDNFVYGNASWNSDGAHASWDIWTTSGKAVEVYSGTVGIVYGIPPEIIEGNLEIYNPYVGAVVQYGHTKPVEGLSPGDMIMPGQHISNVIPADRHIHYSVIRPIRYGLEIEKNDDGGPQYVPILSDSKIGIIYEDKYYKDPFYLHEPTTLAYWNEETLPTGTKQLMLDKFQKYNPDIVLPARKPLDEN